MVNHPNRSKRRNLAVLPQSALAPIAADAVESPLVRLRRMRDEFMARGISLGAGSAAEKILADPDTKGMWNDLLDIYGAVDALLNTIDRR